MEQNNAPLQENSNSTIESVSTDFNNAQETEFNQPTPSGFEHEEELIRCRNVRRIANATCLPLIMFWFLSGVLAYAANIILFLALGQLRAMELLQSSDFQYIFNGFAIILLMSLPFLITAAWSKEPLSKTVAFGRPSLSKTVGVVMLGFGVCAIANYANNIFSSIFTSISGEQVINPHPDYGTGITSFLINIICVAIIPGIMEEFAFRGVILGTTRKYTSDAFAVVMNAVLFSLLHGNLRQIPFSFILGIYLAYITVYTGSVLPAMLVHAINNGLSVVLSFATEAMSPLNQGVTFGLYYLVSLLLGVCGLVFTIKSGDNLKLNTKGPQSNRQTAKWFCSSALFIVFVIYAVLNVIMVQSSGN